MKISWTRDGGTVLITESLVYIYVLSSSCSEIRLNARTKLSLSVIFVQITTARKKRSSRYTCIHSARYVYIKTTASCKKKSVVKYIAALENNSGVDDISLDNNTQRNPINHIPRCISIIRRALQPRQESNTKPRR